MALATLRPLTMAKAYSDDLRRKFLQAHEAGEGTLEELASIFGVSFGWALKISAALGKTGKMERQPGTKRGPVSKITPEVQTFIKASVAARCDITLAEIQQKLFEEKDLRVSIGRLWGVLDELNLRFKKKTLRATEQDLERVQAERAKWVSKIEGIAARKFVFLDESGITTEMTRLYGRTEGGERVNDSAPARWRSLTILGAVALDGWTATMTIEAATDTDVFLAFLDHALCPKLKPGDVVVMDNLRAHKVAGVLDRIQAAGAELLYLPPYSPDLNPIEKCWAQIKQHLRKAKARTVAALESALDEALAMLTSYQIAGYFRHCGYKL